MLYIIYGASGTGKTTLLNCVYEIYGEKSIHKKGTTRSKRQYDEKEILSYPDGLPAERFSPPNGYIYSSYGYDYGIEKKQIADALNNNIPHFLICNDIETIKKIRNDYRNKVRVIYFQIDAPRETILEIQKRRNITDDEINLRMSKIDFLVEQFAQNMYLFDTSLLNRYGDNPEITLHNDIVSLIDDSGAKIGETEVSLKPQLKLFEFLFENLS